jgi:hemolysin III
MKRTRLADREMPDYTQGEEFWNSASHVAGAALGVVALVWCLVLSNSPIEVVSSIVYSVTMIMLYTISGIYHGLQDSTAKRVFQVLDHCTIYLFIAGTYTIVMLCAVRLENPVVAWVVFGIEWGTAAVAVTLNAIDLKRYQPFSMTCYIVMGWVGVLAFFPGLRALGRVGGLLMLAGGVSYTIGAVLYGIGKKKRYAHSVFHIFTLLGTVLHFFCVVFYVL